MNVYVVAAASASVMASALLGNLVRHHRPAPGSEMPVLLQLLRHHRALIVLTDRTGRIQEASESFQRRFANGRPENSSLLHVDQLVAAASGHDYHSILHYVLRERKPLFDFHILVVRGTDELPMNLTVLPVNDGASGIRTLIHLFEPSPADAGSPETDSDLDDSSGIGMLAAGIAHELNTPLGSIILSADIIQDADNPHDVASEAAKIKHQAEHCSDVVRGVLSYAKRDRQTRARHDIGALVRRACRHVENEAKARGISVRVDVSRRAVMILCNAAQVQQVCYNLLSNALHAVGTGGEICVSVRRDSSQGEVAIAFQDNGRGIPNDDLHKIFNPFFTTKPSTEGTGLGLALCQKTVSEHGGRLEVSSEVGVGTTFTAYFPEAK